LPLAAGPSSTAFSFQLSAFSFQPSAFCFLLSDFCFPISARRFARPPAASPKGSTSSEPKTQNSKLELKPKLKLKLSLSPSGWLKSLDGVAPARASRLPASQRLLLLLLLVLVVLLLLYWLHWLLCRGAQLARPKLHCVAGAPSSKLGARRWAAAAAPAATV